MLRRVGRDEQRAVRSRDERPELTSVLTLPLIRRTARKRLGRRAPPRPPEAKPDSDDEVERFLAEGRGVPIAALVPPGQPERLRVIV